MAKSDLITKIHSLYPFLEIDQVNDLVNLIFNQFTDGLKQGKRIEIRGFGSFSLKERKVQVGFPSPDQKVTKLEQRNTIYFRMGKEFFDNLNPSNEH